MGKFNIGDIVTARPKGESVLFMVTMKETVRGKHVQTKEDVAVYIYQVMQIYPVITSKPEKFGESALKLEATDRTKEYAFLMAFIVKERQRKGFHGEPEFIKEIRTNYGEKIFDGTTHLRSVAKKVVSLNREDVSYSNIKSIDEGLDALNDLNTLIKEFGDQEYVFAKELVIRSIKKLTRENRSKKKRKESK